MTPHPQQTGREPLSQEVILARAIEIIDAEGLSALSMRRLASEFDVEAMALYYHFPNKQAILDGVVNAIVLDAAGGAPLPDSDDWRETMRVGILMVRSAMLAHPNASPLIMTQAVDSPAAAVWVEGPLSILAGAGFEGSDLVAAYHQIAAFVFGWHLLASGTREAGVWHGGATTAAQPSSIAARLGAELSDWDQGFEAGLDAILDRLEEERIARLG